jgi:hypothetical protein
MRIINEIAPSHHLQACKSPPVDEKTLFKSKAAIIHLHIVGRDIDFLCSRFGLISPVDVLHRVNSRTRYQLDGFGKLHIR